MAAELNVEQLQKALKSVQELRASVSLVFEKLHSGIKPTTTAVDKEKQFLNDLREGLSKVCNDADEVEKQVGAVATPTTALSLGNLGLLMVDPVVDKSAMHSQIVHTYKWLARSFEYGSAANIILTQSTLRRSANWPSSGSAAKRPRRGQFGTHAVSPQAVDNILQKNFAQHNFPDLSITTDRPFGGPVVMQVTVGRTMRALVTLRGLVIEWVTIKGIHEEVRDDYGRIDLWSKSKYLVFQKVTDHARSAMLHFYTPLVSAVTIDSALRSFLMWLQSYKMLFATPCHKCSRLLLDNLPPTWRDFRTLEAYHDQCRP